MERLKKTIQRLQPQALITEDHRADERAATTSRSYMDSKLEQRRQHIISDVEVSVHTLCSLQGLDLLSG